MGAEKEEIKRELNEIVRKEEEEEERKLMALRKMIEEEVETERKLRQLRRRMEMKKLMEEEKKSEKRELLRKEEAEGEKVDEKKWVHPVHRGMYLPAYKRDEEEEKMVVENREGYKMIDMREVEDSEEKIKREREVVIETPHQRMYLPKRWIEEERKREVKEELRDE